MSTPDTIPETSKALKARRKAMSRPKRMGRGTHREVEIVGQILREQPREMTPTQEKQLATLLGRSVPTTKRIIERARIKFAENAETYVETHLQAATGALEKGDFETAARASQWAMEHLSLEGSRVLEKEQEVSRQPQVLIGIKLGGIGETPAITVPTTAVTVRES